MQAGVDRYFHSDWTGSTRILTAATGNAAHTACRFARFGETSAQSGPDVASLRFAGSLPLPERCRR